MRNKSKHKPITLTQEELEERMERDLLARGREIIRKYLLMNIYATSTNFLHNLLKDIAGDNYASNLVMLPTPNKTGIYPFYYKHQIFGEKEILVNSYPALTYINSELDLHPSLHEKMESYLSAKKIIDADNDLINSYVSSVISVCPNKESMCKVFPECLHTHIRNAPVSDFNVDPKYTIIDEVAQKLKAKYKDGEDALYRVLNVTLLLF